MRVDPAIAALRDDPLPQRRAQAKMIAACDAWRAETRVAPFLTDLDRYGRGAPLADCPDLAGLFAPGDLARQFLGRFCELYCLTLAGEPLGQMPFRHNFDGVLSTLLLARAGTAQLTLTACEPGEYGATAARAIDRSPPAAACVRGSAMPRLIDLADTAGCELGECVAALDAAGFDPRDEASLLHAAGWLRRLGNNRDFLAEIMLAELEKRHREEDGANTYGPQVLMLSPLGAEFFLRANIWPSRDEHVFRASGSGTFVYELPHDHNFDFLTVGYFGPRYWSDYYEYDYGAVAGAVGEPAGLRFVERSRLEPGKLLHYRAHRDVHSQLPPDELSVSLNVMHAGGAQSWLDQYKFDLERNEIAGVLGTGASEVFMRIAVGLGGEEALDLAEPSERPHAADRARRAGGYPRSRRATGSGSGRKGPAVACWRSRRGGGEWRWSR